MPPVIALILVSCLVLSLLAMDRRRFGQVSPALWLPVLWILLAGSRTISQWLNLGNPAYPSAVAEGSPLDVAVFLGIIMLGGMVLLRRRLAIADLIRQNRWLTAFIAIGLASVLWSDFPVIATKRWIKTLGHPVMALIVLTDPKSGEAFRVVMRRAAFVLVSYSVLLIKYYPQYGRQFDQWSGKAFDTGVGLTKNDLGYICMIFGLYFVWELLHRVGKHGGKSSIADVGIRVVFIAAIMWLLKRADSATSIATLTLGIAVLILTSLPAVNKRRIGAYAVTVLLAALCLELLFDPYAYIVELLERNPNLTDRTLVWQDVMALQPNVLLGAGFESFWLGERLEILWSKWWWQPNQAHNGYIEMYLHLGIVGLVLLSGMIVSTFRRVTTQFETDACSASLRLAYLLAIVAFNYAEAGFKAVHLVWTVFYLIAIEYRSTSLAAAERTTMADSRRRERRPFGRLPKKAN